MESVLERVQAVLHDLMPLLRVDGGGLELDRIEGDTVYVRLTGACIGCPGADITLRYGGPVGINSIRLLVRSARRIDAADQILDEVYFVNTSALLHKLLSDTRTRDDMTIQYYAGFGAWSPGQLAMEIARGDWYLVQGDAATIFAADPEHVWDELIEMLAGLWVLGENAK